MTTARTHHRAAPPPRPPAVSSPMFSLREAADYLKCSMSSLYTRLGELEHIKIGKRSLVTKRSCDALIERSIVSAKQVRA